MCVYVNVCVWCAFTTEYISENVIKMANSKSENFRVKFFKLPNFELRCIERGERRKEREREEGGEREEIER